MSSETSLPENSPLTSESNLGTQNTKEFRLYTLKTNHQIPQTQILGESFEDLRGHTLERDPQLPKPQTQTLEHRPSTHRPHSLN